VVADASFVVGNFPTIQHFGTLSVGAGLRAGRVLPSKPSDFVTLRSSPFASPSSRTMRTVPSEQAPTMSPVFPRGTSVNFPEGTLPNATSGKLFPKSDRLPCRSHGAAPGRPANTSEKFTEVKGNTGDIVGACQPLRQRCL